MTHFSYSPNAKEISLNKITTMAITKQVICFLKALMWDMSGNTAVSEKQS